MMPMPQQYLRPTAPFMLPRVLSHYKRCCPLCAGAGRDLKDAQVYLASSLGRWLGEEKTDGAGRCKRVYGEQMHSRCMRCWATAITYQ